MTKDRFSEHADLYSKFRPGYPKALVDNLARQVKEKGSAWDVGTGNGQLAVMLAAHFKSVLATDISESQLENAEKHKRVFYLIQDAQNPEIADNSMDLITVAQAIHWFNFEKFYSNVTRIGKKDSVFAAIGYGLLRIDPEMDKIIDRFYREKINSYWDPERKYIDESYKTIPFPFRELKFPEFRSEYKWNADQLAGYLRTWSAVQNYIKKNNSDPVEEVFPEIKELLKDRMVKVSFPVFSRVGVIR
jgi:hypothetical protein